MKFSPNQNGSIPVCKFTEHCVRVGVLRSNIFKGNKIARSPWDLNLPARSPPCFANAAGWKDHKESM